MKRLLVATSLCVFMATLAHAQTLVLEKHVLGRGGNVAASGSLVLQSTFGQSGIGLSTGGNATLLSGFWHPYAVNATGIGGDPAPVYINGLEQNHPNPFNPITVIPYSVGAGPAAPVTLQIYDVTGRLVTTLVNQVEPPGAYSVEWNGRNNTGESAASGIYFYRLRVGQFVSTKKLVLLK